MKTKIILGICILALLMLSGCEKSIIEKEEQNLSEYKSYCTLDGKDIDCNEETIKETIYNYSSGIQKLEIGKMDKKYLEKPNLRIKDFDTLCVQNDRFLNHWCIKETYSLKILKVNEVYECLKDCPSNESPEGCKIGRCKKEINKDCVKFDWSANGYGDGYNYFEVNCEEDLIEVEYEYNVKTKHDFSGNNIQ